MKSAPIIGALTSATMNAHSKLRPRPRSNFNVVDPYVLMRAPLAANNAGDKASEEGWKLRGTTETSAPVSIKNVLLVRLSVSESLLMDKLTDPKESWRHSSEGGS